MAPTICSGKKRESRNLINSNIRRNGGQGSHQLNQTLSNIVNYVVKDSLNARVSTSLRLKTYSHSDKFFSLSDNAVTSSRHSDTENSIDLRLAGEAQVTDLTPTYSANTNSTSLSSPLSPLLSSAIKVATSQNGKTSSSTSPFEEKRFFRYSTIKKNSSDNDATDLYKENIEGKDSKAFKKRANQIHSSEMRKRLYNSNDINSEEDEEQEEVQDHEMSNGSDTDMDANESGSITSLDAEKSAKFKIGNSPLLRDKHQQTENNVGNKTDDNRRTLASISSTDGLLSIAIKTIKLVKRNQLLQQRLTQLQMETSEFIQSVLANPENICFRENMKQCKRQEVDDHNV